MLNAEEQEEISRFRVSFAYFKEFVSEKKIEYDEERRNKF